MARLAAILVAMTCLVSSGCKSKVTKDNFEKIKEGMSLSEVQAILGEGKLQADGTGIPAAHGIHVGGGGGARNSEIYLWESDERSITLTFVSGKLKHKASKGL